MNSAIFTVIFTIFSLLSGENDTAPWHDPAATGRVTVQHSPGSSEAVLDLNTISLPFDYSRGFRAYTATGRPVSYYRLSQSLLLFPPSKDGADEMIFIYSGHEKPFRNHPSADQFKRRRFPGALTLKNVKREHPESMIAWHDLGRKGRMDSFSRTARDFEKQIETLNGDFIDGAIKRHAEGALTGSCGDGVLPEGFENTADSFERFNEDFFLAASRHLGESFFVYFPEYDRGSLVPRIFFIRRPFDTDGPSISIYRGNIVIPETGEYEFRLRFNSTAILRIDGITAYSKFAAKNDEAELFGCTGDATVSLVKGTHRFEYLYYKGNRTVWASASWRKKGASAPFRLLSETDFACVMPLKTVSIDNREGLFYPIVTRDDSMTLHTGKTKKYTLEKYSVLPDIPGGYSWEADGRPFPSDHSIFAMKQGSAVHTMRIIPHENSGFAPLEINRPPRTHLSVPCIPELSLRLWAPHFLFSDEYCDFTLEVDSRMPESFNAELETTADAASPFFKSGKRPVHIEGFPLESEYRFRPGRALKHETRIAAAEVDTPFTVGFSIAIPGLVCDKKGMRVIKASAPLPEGFKATPDGLCDGIGNRLLIILHRTTLHEIRAWELLKKIGGGLGIPERLLVIAPDPDGGLERRLSEAFPSGGLTFLKWNGQPTPSGSPSLDSLPRFAEAIDKNAFDTAVIIPLSGPSRGVLGKREELNVMAFLIERIQLKRDVREIYLSTPFSCSGDPDETAFNELLRKLRREKGISFIELDALLKKRGGDASAAETILSEISKK